MVMRQKKGRKREGVKSNRIKQGDQRPDYSREWAGMVPVRT